MSVSEAPQPSTPSLETFLQDIAALETIFEHWDENQINALRSYKKSVDELHKEALRRLIVHLKTDPKALSLLKEAVEDEVVYAVFRHFELIKPSLQERVEAALETIRPMLASHGGDVELISIQPPDKVEVKFLGACDGCPASMLTFTAGVKKAIEEACPEITKIEQIKGLSAVSETDERVHFISPFAAKEKNDWLDAAALEDVPEGGILALTIKGEPLLLSRNGETVTCFQNACAHLNLPLDEGDIENGILTCPHHGFQYSLNSGECLTAPEVQLQPHAVRVLKNRIEVRLTL